jgi:ABC-type antimicrobial peptide transport system permease subunit
VQGGLALLLSIVGTYGIVAYSLSARTREIGIRIALGEAANAIQLRVVRQALAPAMLGIGIGAAISSFTAHWLEGFVLGFGARDVTTLRRSVSW